MESNTKIIFSTLLIWIFNIELENKDPFTLCTQVWMRLAMSHCQRYYLCKYLACNLSSDDQQVSIFSTMIIPIEA